MIFRTLRLTLLLLLLAVSVSPILAWVGHDIDEKGASGQVSRAAASGPQRAILILVNFPDVTNSTSHSDTSNILTSMNAYYNENSYGLLSFQFDITPTPSSPRYVMPNNMGYYGADTSTANSRLIEDALRAAYSTGVNLASYKLATVVHSGGDEAITHVSGDIHSYTIPDFPFRPSPLTLIRISTSVLAETDPMGVYAHESGHLLGLPDLYDVTGQIDPVNNFIGYWDLMALGEWNPNNGNPLDPLPGTYPAHMSAWAKIELGLVPISRVITIQSGEAENVTVQNLELPTTGYQAVKVPLAYNTDGSLTYYLLEVRARLGVYDAHLPFPSSYTYGGLLIYKVNETISTGHGSVRLVDAHPGGSLNDAGFGPCGVPCSNNTFWDQQNYVKVIVTNATATAYTVAVDRTASPPFLLQINTPSQGVLVSVDGQNMTSDSSNQLRLTVRYGPHTVFVETTIPISIGSTSVELGLSNRFVGWDDGGTVNPRGVSVLGDTVITAIYRVTIEPSFSLGVTALIILVTAAAAATLYRHRARPPPAAAPSTTQEITLDPTSNERALVPRDDRLSAGSDKRDDKTESPNP